MPAVSSQRSPTFQGLGLQVQLIYPFPPWPGMDTNFPWCLIPIYWHNSITTSPKKRKFFYIILPIQKNQIHTPKTCILKTTLTIQGRCKKQMSHLPILILKDIESHLNIYKQDACFCVYHRCVPILSEKRVINKQEKRQARWHRPVIQWLEGKGKRVEGSRTPATT